MYNLQIKYTPLITAAREGSDVNVRLLLDYGADPHATGLEVSVYIWLLLYN